MIRGPGRIHSLEILRLSFSFLSGVWMMRYIAHTHHSSEKEKDNINNKSEVLMTLLKYGCNSMSFFLFCCSYSMKSPTKNPMSESSYILFLFLSQSSMYSLGASVVPAFDRIFQFFKNNFQNLQTIYQSYIRKTP